MRSMAKRIGLYGFFQNDRFGEFFQYKGYPLITKGDSVSSQRMRRYEAHQCSKQYADYSFVLSSYGYVSMQPALAAMKYPPPRSIESKSLNSDGAFGSYTS